MRGVGNFDTSATVTLRLPGGYPTGCSTGCSAVCWHLMLYVCLNPLVECARVPRYRYVRSDYRDDAHTKLDSVKHSAMAR